MAHTPGKWIDVNVATPDLIEGKDYSENVFAIVDGELKVMCYGYYHDSECGGFFWANCNGDIFGEAEWDDDYNVTAWMPLPKVSDFNAEGGQS